METWVWEVKHKRKDAIDVPGVPTKTLMVVATSAGNAIEAALDHLQSDFEEVVVGMKLIGEVVLAVDVKKLR